MNLINYETKNLRKHIYKLESENCLQWKAMLTVRFQSWLTKSNPFKWLWKKDKHFVEKRKINREFLKQNIAFLQNELSSINEITKLLMEMQWSVLYTIPKNSSTFENYNHTQCKSLHHLQPQSEQREIHARFQQLPNQSHLNKIMKHKIMMN